MALEQELRVIDSLLSFAQITEYITKQRRSQSDWYLIQMMPEQRSVAVKGFPRLNLDQAERELADLEKAFQNTANQVVLASAESLIELKKAYPNYFADTKFFIVTLRRFFASVGL